MVLVLKESDERFHVSGKHSLAHLFMNLFTLIELFLRLGLKNSTTPAGCFAAAGPLMFSCASAERFVHVSKSG
jgi:hypothetical protein